jgi:hypothetical protein
MRKAIASLSMKIAEGGPTEFRAAILRELAKLGWSKPVRISPDLNITVAAMKGRTAACIQFGNVSRLYADLMKVQALFDLGKCDGAIFILLSKGAADVMSSNLAHSDRLVKELRVFRSIINVPIKILSVE